MYKDLNKVIKLLRRWWNSHPKRHSHDWELVGYGGAGWYLLRCKDPACEEIEID